MNCVSPSVLWKKFGTGTPQSHLHMQHGMDASSSIITKSVALAPRLYKLSFIQNSGHSQCKVQCPVEYYRYTAKHAAIIVALHISTWHYDRIQHATSICLEWRYRAL